MQEEMINAAEDVAQGTYARHVEKGFVKKRKLQNI